MHRTQVGRLCDHLCVVSHATFNDAVIPKQVRDRVTNTTRPAMDVMTRSSVYRSEAEGGRSGVS